MVRLLVFIYEEQEGCIKIAGFVSSNFRITNGTRQGSVLSPTLFSVYLDDIIKILRNKGLGCHIAGIWVGATAYADDLALMAPSRETMDKMLNVCDNYAKEHNLVFSTDKNPVKSKSKCIFMSGKEGSAVPENVPTNLQLDGKDLPWVATASHLGHEMHQSCSMDHDVKVKRAIFIGSSVDIREKFGFAKPEQILKAVRIYSLYLYGGMLWDFTSERTSQFCKAWNTCIKLAYDLPRNTKTFIVDNYLAINFDSVMKELFSRYVNFVKSLQK